MWLTTGLVVVLIAGLLVAHRCLRPSASPAPASAQALPSATVKPTVLFVDSYHEGYPWSEGIIQGCCNTFKVLRQPDGSLDCSGSRVNLRLTRMDTKRNGSEEFKRKAGQKVRDLIEQTRPDLVICADDNSTAYVLARWYKGSKLPFIFCGVNWDASAYGLPCANVTGMLEVSLIDDMLELMGRYAKGRRLGLLGARNESNQKEAENYTRKLGVSLEEVVFVDDFPQWRRAFLDLQGKLDMLILAPPSFLASEADKAEARRFVLENTRIPTGSVEDWIAPYSLVCYAKLATEQGEWAAQSAMRVLSGTPPREIPVVGNRSAAVMLNMPLARRMGVVFPVDTIQQAVLVGDAER